jgi:hypothetical protein
MPEGPPAVIATHTHEFVSNVVISTPLHGIVISTSVDAVVATSGPFDELITSLSA